MHALTRLLRPKMFYINNSRTIQFYQKFIKIFSLRFIFLSQNAINILSLDQVHTCGRIHILLGTITFKNVSAVIVSVRTALKLLVHGFPFTGNPHKYNGIYLIFVLDTNRLIQPIYIQMEQSAKAHLALCRSFQNMVRPLPVPVILSHLLCLFSFQIFQNCLCHRIDDDWFCQMGVHPGRPARLRQRHWQSWQ